MPATEGNSDQMDSLIKTILDCMKKAVVDNNNVFFAFQELRTLVNESLESGELRNKDLREIIGVLKREGKIKSKKVAGRDLYVLTEIIEVFRSSLSTNSPR